MDLMSEVGKMLKEAVSPAPAPTPINSITLPEELILAPKPKAKYQVDPLYAGAAGLVLTALYLMRKK